MPHTPSASGSGPPLSKLLDPLGIVLITRERLQEAFDDAVQRGRMTRDDAQELIAALIGRGRAGTEDFAELERRLGFRREGDGEATPAGGVQADGPPFEGYDELTAAQITGRLPTLAPAELRRLRDHEQRHANRKSVLQAVERKLA